MIKHPDGFWRSKPAGFDGVFDWEFLKPAFEGTRIMPMDLDAVVERNGRFLVFETKSPGKCVPVGQRITLDALLKTRKFTVFLLVGKSDKELHSMTVVTPDYTMDTGLLIKPVSPTYIIAKTRAWLRWANGGELKDDDQFFREYDDEIIREDESKAVRLGSQNETTN